MDSYTGFREKRNVNSKVRGTRRTVIPPGGLYWPKESRATRADNYYDSYAHWKENILHDIRRSEPYTKPHYDNRPVRRSQAVTKYNFIPPSQKQQKVVTKTSSYKNKEVDQIGELLKKSHSVPFDKPKYEDSFDDGDRIFQSKFTEDFSKSKLDDEE